MSIAKPVAERTSSLPLKVKRWRPFRIDSLRTIRGLVVPLVAASIWEIVARNKLLSSSLFPSLSGVAYVWWDWIFGTNQSALVYSGTWLTHVEASTQRVMLGFVLGSLAPGLFSGP